MLDEIKDICRDSGWREVGPDHDLATWLRQQLARLASLECEVKALRSQVADEDRLAEANISLENELCNLEEKLARVSKAIDS